MSKHDPQTRDFIDQVQDTLHDMNSARIFIRDLPNTAGMIDWAPQYHLTKGNLLLLISYSNQLMTRAARAAAALDEARMAHVKSVQTDEKSANLELAADIKTD